MKTRVIKDRTMQEAAMRAGLRMVLIDIEASVEFYDQTRSYFRKKVKDRDRENAAHSDSYWDEDLGGVTRGELESERGLELQEMLQLNSYFAILNVFAAFERCLLRTFQDTKHLKLVTDKRKYLTLDGYKDSLKGLGIDLTSPPFKWSDIRKLQSYRNAIAHQGGFVTDDNLSRLRSYGYTKEGQRIKISDAYFRSAVELVKISSTELVKEYSKMLRKRTSGSTKHP